ncbi:MAG: ribbon-helix-helix domain-containing protein [Rickettsiales bacterium]|jgi:predicted DNA-binding ribbon-helix-helix protein|nr:ribbon-helix-helix domain-containing protein [Rickettsiales bacterium]
MKKRSATIAGHSTSFSIEDEFFEELRRIAAARGISMNALASRIDAEGGGNLSSKLRVFAFLNRVSTGGHAPGDESAPGESEAGGSTAGEFVSGESIAE